VLAGQGAALALPLLDAMVPALDADGQDGSEADTRGSASSTCHTGADADMDSAGGEGALGELSPRAHVRSRRSRTS
jgi:hypothetical protein